MTDSVLDRFRLTDQVAVVTGGSRGLGQAMATALNKRGYDLISEGTDNHLMLIDLRNKNLTGKKAQETLDKAEKKIYEVTSTPTLSKFTSLRESLKDAWSRLEHLHENKDELRGVRTGSGGRGKQARRSGR